MLCPHARSPWSDANSISTRPDGWHRAHLCAIEEVIPVIESLAAVMSAQGYAHEDDFGVLLALEQALVNAIKHGHHYDLTKRVSVRYRVSRTHTLVEVRDQGPGFDPAAPENRERPSGRGLLLVRKYTSRLLHKRRGNGVRLCKYAYRLLSQD